MRYSRGAARVAKARRKAPQWSRQNENKTDRELPKSLSVGGFAGIPRGVSGAIGKISYPLALIDHTLKQFETIRD